MRRVLAGAVGLLAMSGCASLAPPSERSDVLRRVLSATVQLRSEREGGARRAGSGVVIAADAGAQRSWVITARHFLEPATEQKIYLTAPVRSSRAKADVVALAQDVDLAVVEIKGVVLPVVRLKDEARLGDEVWVVGFPWGRRLTLVSGIVSQIASDESEAPIAGPPRMVDASVSYGASGGGVFDAGTGMLIGIVEGYRTARVTVQSTPERTVDLPVPGETTVIPTAAIRRFLLDAGLGRLLEY